MILNPSICLFLCLLSVVSYAQEQQKILLMTGKEIEGRVTGQDSAYLYYDLFKSNGSFKPKKLDIERVFSINRGDVEERVIYTMDTAVGNYFTVDEMRYYIKGEQDAMRFYKANWVITAGAPVTAGLGFVLSGTVLAFAVPFTYLVTTGIPKYNVERNNPASANLMAQPAYILGYERTARNKRLFKALSVGLLGTAIGFTAGQFVRMQ